MAPVEIHYFKIRGRAELARLILEEAAVEYKNVFIDDWANKKQQASLYPFGQLPVLVESDGTVIPQSFAIARHLARVHGLAGKSVKESALTDAYSEQLLDTFNKFVRAFFFSKDKAADVAAFFDNDLAPLIAPLEKILSSSASGFFTENVSYADLFSFDFFDALLNIRSNALDAFPGFKKHYEKVKALPRVHAYITSDRRLPPPSL